MTQMGADGEGEKDPESHAIIGACMAVHSELGPGFLEAVYQAALEIELSLRGIPFRSQVEVPVFYKGRKLDRIYRADAVCFSDLLVELKALRTLSPNEHAQTINYLKATGYRRALLINFGAPRLEFRRFVYSPKRQPPPAMA